MAGNEAVQNADSDAAWGLECRNWWGQGQGQAEVTFQYANVSFFIRVGGWC